MIWFVYLMGQDCQEIDNVGVVGAYRHEVNVTTCRFRQSAVSVGVVHELRRLQGCKHVPNGVTRVMIVSLPLSGVMKRCAQIKPW